MRDQVLRWHVYADARELLAEAEAVVNRAATEAVEQRGRFDIVLAGGSTPRGLYERLAVAGAGGPGWHVWFGDERCLGANDPERNETMARQAWLDQSGIPPEQIHGIPPILDPVAAAAAYSASLVGLSDFDLVLLGIGEDGHTASLFPGDETGQTVASTDALPVFDAPKPPPQRVSLSADRLSRSRQVIVLATGRGKSDAITRWRRGDDLPIGRITPRSGIDVFADREAVPEIGPEAPSY